MWKGGAILTAGGAGVEGNIVDWHWVAVFHARCESGLAPLQRNVSVCKIGRKKFGIPVD